MIRWYSTSILRSWNSIIQISLNRLIWRILINSNTWTHTITSLSISVERCLLTKETISTVKLLLDWIVLHVLLLFHHLDILIILLLLILLLILYQLIPMSWWQTPLVVAISYFICPSIVQRCVICSINTLLKVRVLWILQISALVLLNLSSMFKWWFPLHLVICWFLLRNFNWWLSWYMLNCISKLRFCINTCLSFFLILLNYLTVLDVIKENRWNIWFNLLLFSWWLILVFQLNLRVVWSTSKDDDRTLITVLSILLIYF